MGDRAVGSARGLNVEASDMRVDIVRKAVRALNPEARHGANVK